MSRLFLFLRREKVSKVSIIVHNENIYKSYLELYLILLVFCLKTWYFVIAHTSIFREGISATKVDKSFEC